MIVKQNSIKTYQQHNVLQFYLHQDLDFKVQIKQSWLQINLYFYLSTIVKLSCLMLLYQLIQQQTFHYYCSCQLCSKNFNCYFKYLMIHYQNHQIHLRLLNLKSIQVSQILIQCLIDHYSLLQISIILIFRCCLSYWCNII